MVRHPKYDRETVDNDIALLKIKTNEDFGPKRKSRKFRNANSFSTVCLPDQDEELPMDTKCTILGWGKEKPKHVLGSEVLREAKIPIASKQDCENYQKSSGYYFSDNMFCAGYKQGQVDTCTGDSGGPLLCEKDGRWTVYGITSFGEGCGEEGKYGMYAKVPNYTEWIDSIIWNVE